MQCKKQNGVSSQNQTTTKKHQTYETSKDVLK